MYHANKDFVFLLLFSKNSFKNGLKRKISSRETLKTVCLLYVIKMTLEREAVRDGGGAQDSDYRW